MSTPITERAIFGEINGCEVSIYHDPESFEPVDVPCSVCEKRDGDPVFVYKATGFRIIEIQSNGVKLSPEHPAFREVQRRIDSSKAFGKAFCGECTFVHSMLAELEDSFELPKFSALLGLLEQD
jgi:hypothetical protein